MSNIPKNTTSTTITALRYRDTKTAIEWLCNAFGFEKQLVVPDDDGNIVHAQLTFGHGMIMVGSISDTEFGKYMKQPDEVDGAEKQSVYLIVNDADEVYEQSKAEGAEILIDIKDEDYVFLP